MKIFNVLLIIPLFINKVSSFYYYTTANTIKKEYQSFLDSTIKPDLSIYNKNISLYVNDQQIIKHNRKQYICGYLNIRNLCQLLSFSSKDKLQIESIQYVKDDMIKIDWLFHCLHVLVMRGSSIYLIHHENEKVKKHSITIDTINLITNYDIQKEYKHPNLYKPIYIKPKKNDKGRFY